RAGGPGWGEARAGLHIDISVGAPQRPGAGGGIGVRALQLIPPMRRNSGVGVQGKAVDTGTPRSRECRPFSCIAKARAEAAHFLSRAFPKGDALLHGSRHGAGEIWFVVAQRIIPGGYSSLNARFQISEPTQHTDDAVTELLEDRGNVCIAGRCGFDKAGLEASFGAIEVDALHEDAMEMEIHIERTAKTLDKR